MRCTADNATAATRSRSPLVASCGLAGCMVLLEASHRCRGVGAKLGPGCAAVKTGWGVGGTPCQYSAWSKCFTPAVSHDRNHLLSQTENQLKHTCTAKSSNNGTDLMQVGLICTAKAGGVRGHCCCAWRRSQLTQARSVRLAQTGCQNGTHRVGTSQLREQPKLGLCLKTSALQRGCRSRICHPWHVPKREAPFVLYPRDAL